MSDTEDKTQLDSELKAYLSGEDGVSAAYRQAGTEEPPEELDRLILAAARGAVQKNKPLAAATSSRQKYSLAASFMVGVLVTSLYFNRPDDRAEEDAAVFSTIELRTSAPAAEQPTPAFAPAAPAISDANTQPETPEQEVSQQVLQAGQEVARAVAPAQPQETAQAKAEEDAGAGLADNANSEREVAAETDAARRIANAAAIPVTAPAAAPPAVATAVTEAPPEPQLEEISVTGSRIVRDEEPDTFYRQTREEWLEEILSLREEALAEQELLQEINARLDEEVQLFSEIYPDFDLVSELEALEE